MEKKNKKEKVKVNPKNLVSQKAQLEHIRKRNITILALGTVLMLITIAVSVMAGAAKTQQLTVTMALNQYRMGSKNLTSAVQSYAVTGEQQYYNDYMNELNVDKNRDNALAILEEEGLEDAEWAIIDQISSLSNGLVPLEEAAMASVSAGDLVSAQGSVFGHEYESTVVKINDLTETLIATVQGRLANASNICSGIQNAAQLILLAAFLFIAKQFINVIGFSERELLVPIEKVSAEMRNLAQGDFDQVLDLKEDESEVGTMVAAIATMKRNNSGMISEISHVLGAMGDGNYNFVLEKDYVGAFVEIKDSLEKIGAKIR